MIFSQMVSDFFVKKNFKSYSIDIISHLGFVFDDTKVIYITKLDRYSLLNTALIMRKASGLSIMNYKLDGKLKDDKLVPHFFSSLPLAHC